MSSQDFILSLPVLIVVGTASLLLVIDLFIGGARRTVTAILAALGLIAAMITAGLQFGRTGQAFSGMLVHDGFGSFLQLLFLAAGLVAIAQALEYIRRRGIERGEYYSLLLFSISGMMLMANAGDLIVIFVALELLSIPLYILSGFARPQPASEESAMKYFLLGAFASSFLVYGIAMIFGTTGTTQLSGIMAALQGMETVPTLFLIGAGLILVGLGFKIAAVPFHMWTPDVYQGAPSSVTSFMSVGAKAGGFAALLRILMAAFPQASSAWVPVTAWLSALTMIWGNIAAIAQNNIKRMLAYSSIAHAGYILMAVPAIANPAIAGEAINSALFYLAAYAITNLGTWGVVLALEKADGSGLEINDYSGLARRKPALALAMALFMLSLTGVPPSIGFVGKFFLFRAVVDAGIVWLAIVGVLTSVISAYFYLRIIVMMYMAEGEVETVGDRALNSTIGLTALATLFFGVLPGPLLALVAQSGLMNLLP
ncbi:MAG: NADH-quinone oxidoreductase subunit N [Anaerolineales bacterium]